MTKKTKVGNSELLEDNLLGAEGLLSKNIDELIILKTVPKIFLFLIKKCKFIINSY